jgi:hypothetical protein
VNGQQLINAWNDHAPRKDQGKITLQAGQKYDIKLNYYERKGGAVMQLYWSTPSKAQQIIPKAYLYSSVSTHSGSDSSTNSSGGFNTHSGSDSRTNITF